MSAASTTSVPRTSTRPGPAGPIGVIPALDGIAASGLRLERLGTGATHSVQLRGGLSF